ncbi:MAG TPA: crosslink repair DNA glycosylase YcaQ family protein [Anaerolineaceae bacterium]|nr:crosslink repair DNA glycosylase YcaQ family protein [Anaerolineaceae bacterium]
MPARITLTQRQARRFLLAHQKLWPPYQLQGKAGILAYIRHVNCIQFDPLNIAGHNHELVLQSRVRDFRPAMLQELLYQDRRLLDGWDKNMSIYPLEDWPFFRRQREAALRRLGSDGRPAAVILPEVRREFTTRGPLSSIDLDYNQSVDWSWAPTRLARAALESMYFWGELVIHHKVHTRRVYDLAYRHIPAALLEAPDPNPSEEAFQDWYIYRRLGGVGLLSSRGGDAWLGMGAIKAPQRAATFQRLLARGQVVEITVEGFHYPLYMRSIDQSALETVLQGGEPTPQAVILAPLDNLLWDRRLVEGLFNFNYRWEVYKPQTEREYGYYVLPILFGDRFIARFEPVRKLKTRSAQVKNWWWEPGVIQTDEMRACLQECFQRFAAFLGIDHLENTAQIMEK